MKDLPDTQKVLILLTDGQNTAGEVSPEDAGILAKETGLRIHTIGVGADEVWVRTFLGTQKINPSSELDEVLLQSLASDTGGSYFRARSTEELENIYSMIDVIEPVEIEKEVFRPRQALYIWPLGFAVLAIGSWFLILIYRQNLLKRMARRHLWQKQMLKSYITLLFSRYCIIPLQVQVCRLVICLVQEQFQE